MSIIGIILKQFADFYELLGAYVLIWVEPEVEVVTWSFYNLNISSKEFGSRSDSKLYQQYEKGKKLNEKR